MALLIENIAALDEEAQRRYLNYALSVITSRALPDVRDGLKPVQRRILYAMYNDQRLLPDAKYRKCASVVGDVLGKYHPHGDSSVYDALVRMAQDFSLRYPLVDGQGNFGSQDGDSAAAYRYTECRLRNICLELLDEIKQNTVSFRPTFDGVRFEPIVLPSRIPNLLVNGSQGIAVGMATSIPPHNLGEIVDACIALIDKPDSELDGLLKHVKGPDFPTYGEIHATKQEIAKIYETGHGSLRLRAQYHIENPQDKREAPVIIITSIPYAVTRSSIMEKIGQIMIDKKLPQLVHFRDESTRDVRVVLELKKGSDPLLVMAYLFRNTSLQVNVQFNLTCLVPTENPEIGSPKQLSLLECLRYFLQFRFEVVTNKLIHEKSELEKRLHLLEGLGVIHGVLDETLQIIRKSEGKADAAQKLMKRFKLDEEQVDAILELRLYRLARLELLIIQKELNEKQAALHRVNQLLKHDKLRWQIVREELSTIRSQYGDKRRTKLNFSVEEEMFDKDSFIIAEDVNVIVTKEGWVKRVGHLRDISSTRVRENDEVLAVVSGSTRDNIVFFTNFGTAYTCKIADIPASTGYGEPLQKLFKFDDQERIVAAIAKLAKGQESTICAVSKRGLGLRFSLELYLESSTRNGRRFMRLDEGDEAIALRVASDHAPLTVVTQQGRTLTCLVKEIALLSGAGKGVRLIKMDTTDSIFAIATGEGLEITNDKGKTFVVGAKSNEIVSRGGKGRELFKRGIIVAATQLKPVQPALDIPR